jgi:tRNA (uracil-5-)-methyltransferase TRM9
MNAAAAARLLDLNRDFYDRFGRDFSATRRRLQPGVKRILQELKGDESILDLGCGNGEMARAQAQRGQRGPYLGLDFSLPLLREARPWPEDFSAKFLQAELTQLSMIGDRLSVAGGWTLITAFAVLHHIPGEQLRLNILREVGGLLAENGRFILSNWQFLESARLTARLQPWSAIGLADADVDPGDHLLDWRSGGRGLRYVHQFSAQELSGLAAQVGLHVRDSFVSDGEGGKLGLYQVWEK